MRRLIRKYKAWRILKERKRRIFIYVEKKEDEQKDVWARFKIWTLNPETNDYERAFALKNLSICEPIDIRHSIMSDKDGNSFYCVELLFNDNTYLQSCTSMNKFIDFFGLDVVDVFGKNTIQD